MEKIFFPKNFFWGSATSAYQVEGGIENNDFSQYFPAGRACDHYNLYEKDFDLLLKLNQNAYRFSIEWSRIEPREGEFDKNEIYHYKQFIEALKKRKITPFVTLHHFTNPRWLLEKGSWENEKVVFYFERFVRRVFEELGNLADFWITINEPLVFSSLSFLSGVWPPKKKNPIAFFRVIKNLIRAHKNVYYLLHSLRKNINVGISHSTIYFRAFNEKSALDKINAKINHYFWNELLIKLIRKELDFIGINYYSAQSYKFPWKLKPKTKILADNGWEVFPQGLYEIVKCFSKFNLPIFITENGIADARDALRKNYIKEHLFWLSKAILEGVKVLGYFHWSLLDNLEWEAGFKYRFGLIEVDFQTLERKLRNSALFYAKICKENALILNENENIN